MPTPIIAQTISIEGPDAVAFAQAQFSANLAGLACGRWQFGAWLDAQGRVRALFHLAKLADERLLLVLRGGQAAVLVQAMQRFVLRSKVRLEAAASAALSTGPALPLGQVEENAGSLRLGCGEHSLCLGDTSDDAWQLPQLRLGWPWLPETLLDQLLPPALDLERLGATALDKGCYPGQEIVARLHYRGGHKWHLQRVRLPAATAAAPGTALYASAQAAGHLLNLAPAPDSLEALAVLSEQAAGHSLFTQEGDAAQLLDCAHIPVQKAI